MKIWRWANVKRQTLIAAFSMFGFVVLCTILTDAWNYSAFLFTVLHWPADFIKLFLYGQFDLSGFVAQSISVLIYGMLFAVMLKRSGTLWNYGE